MDDFRIYDRFSYKYRLLYCLMLNYYRNFYADNKFKGKVLVIGTCRKELIKNYDKVYYIIQKYKKEDIITLKKFICFYDNQLKLLFDKLDDKNIDYEQFINNIKKEYISSKSIYRKLKFGYDNSKLPQDKNIIFMELNDTDKIQEKHLIRDIFIPESFSLEDKENNNTNELCRVLKLFVLSIRKTKEILIKNNANKTDFLSLSIFLNTPDGLDIEDEIHNLLRITELNEDEDD